MTHIWSVLCKKASVDRETNVVSLFEVIEKLTITQNPLAPTQVVPSEFVMPLDFEIVTLISNITKQDKKPLIKIELFNSKEEKMGEIEDQLKVTPVEATSLRSRVVFNTIKIKGAGTYIFKINIKKNKAEDFTEVAKIPLEVEIVKVTTK